MDPSSPFPSRPQPPASRVLPWLMLALTVLGGVVVWRGSAEAARQRARVLLAHRAEDVVARLEERLQTSRQIVLGGRGLFEATGDVTREAWRRYLAPLWTDERSRGTFGVGFTRWIPADALEAHLRAERAGGRPGYAIWPAGERAAYTSVVMLEPSSPGNDRVIGLDMYADPTRSAAMDEARDAGVPTLSQRLILPLEPDAEPQPAIVLYAPVFRPGLPTATVEARRAALQGWVFTALRTGDLVAQTLGRLPDDVDFSIEEPDTGAVLFATVPVRPSGALAVRQEAEVLGRRWAFTFVARPGFAARLGDVPGGALLALALGALLTVGAFLLQRRAEEEDAAREAARRRILFEASPDGMVLLDPATGAIVEFNSAAHTQLGYTREEFARLTVFDVEAAEPPDRARDRIAAVLRSGRGDFETQQRTKEGELRQVLVTAQLVDVPGQRAYQCVWRDVTERRRVEEALREAHTQLQRLGDNLPGGYVYQLVTVPGQPIRFTYLSAGVEQVHGVRREDVLADPRILYDLVPAEDRARLEEAEARAGQDLVPLSVEFPSRSRTGAELWLRVSSAPTRLPDGTTRWDGVAIDVTDLRRAEADRLLRSKLESTGLLAGGIAHDFNNLLTTVLLGVELAQAESESAVARDALGGVVEALEVAQSLTGQLITFARGGAPVRRLADVERLVRESTRLALTGAPVGSRITAAPALWPAEVDEGQIAQVIRNLVLNAREAMPAGGVVSIELRNTTLGPDAASRAPPGDYVELTVADQGGGVPPDVLPRIFDPYFSTKERGAKKGMGLGLTICHSVVRRHGGAISVTSVPGKGATFRVLLPARSGAALPEAAPRAAVSAPRGPTRGKVLVMDDEATLRRMTAAALEQLGCTVVEAKDGEEAVERWGEARASGAPFDLLLLDLTVREGMGALGTMRLLREVDSGTPVVLMSGYADDDAVLDPARHGFSDALRKPFDVGGLRAMLERNLRGA